MIFLFILFVFLLSEVLNHFGALYGTIEWYAGLIGGIALLLYVVRRISVIQIR